MFEILWWIETKTKTGLIKYKATDKPTRKKWAVQKAKEILELRNDTENLKLYEDKPRKKGVVKIKLDDISDCMLHNIAFMYLAYVDKSIWYYNRTNWINHDLCSLCLQ